MESKQDDIALKWKLICGTNKLENKRVDQNDTSESVHHLLSAAKPILNGSVSH